MDDLMSKLQGILGTPEGQEQLKNIQNMLGMSTPQQDAPPSPSPAAGGGGFDLSALASLFGGGSQPAPSSAAPGEPAQSAQGNSGGFDLSALSGILQGLGSGASAPSGGGTSNEGASSGGLDLSGLAGMLGGLGGMGQTNQTASAPLEMPGMPGIDINMILKLQKVFQMMKSTNDKDSQLLLALKPHFSERRQAKVDQAISIMRLLSMLPALKESGIFAGL